MMPNQAAAAGAPIMHYLVSVFLILAAALSLGANASDFYPVTKGDREFLSEVVKAVTSKDTAWIADHVNYPLSVTTDKGKRLIRGKHEFSVILKRKLTDKVVAEIVEHSKRPLFKNWRGVMVGQGILWFTEYPSGSLPQSKYIVLAIGNFAFQPQSWANPQSGADRGQPSRSETNRTSAAATSGRSP